MPTRTTRSSSSRPSTASPCRVLDGSGGTSISAATWATIAKPCVARLRRRCYQPHIKSRGQERIEKRQRGKKARRWVVERVASWLNRYRRILVRWEKKAANFLGLLHLVFAHILWRNS